MRSIRLSVATIALLALLACGSLAVDAAAGLYTSRDHVVELTSANFQKEVIGSSDVWLVEFYGECDTQRGDREAAGERATDSEPAELGPAAQLGSASVATTAVSRIRCSWMQI